MTWFKVDDHLHSHRKTMRAGTEAMGLWVLAGSWSAAEESDGWVPEYVLGRLAGAGAEQMAQRLVAAGLWSEGEVDGEVGYQFHAWDEYQPTRQQLMEKREAARERMRKARKSGGDVRANTSSTDGDGSRDVTPTPTRPDPTSKTLTAADAAAFERFWATYPRKVGKRAAERKLAQVLRETDIDTVMAGLERAVTGWRREGTETRFIPHPATWLNQGRWDDAPVPLEQPPAAPAARPATLRQCDGHQCPGGRHEWSDARNRYVCQGAA